MLKELATPLFRLLVLPLLVLAVSCGGDHGIEEPLLEEEPAPVGDTSSAFGSLYGNYFLIESNCPGDGSALCVAQSEAAVQLQDGFRFNNEGAPMVGFVDEDKKLRFFSSVDDATVNCTANAESGAIVGVCSYPDAGLTSTCRFIYSKQFAGTYTPVWNDCDSDDSDMEVGQQASQVTLTGAFDYQTTSPDKYFGVVQAGQILFNLDALQAPVFVLPSDNPDFNCEAVVSRDTMTGTCYDLTQSPATLCTFGYEAAARVAGVDLSDDSLFPSPAITPTVSPTPVSDMKGTYSPLSNDCDNDGNVIEVFQEGTSLGLLGGFDYQAADPDMYAGTLDTTGTMRFSVLGSDDRAFCTANLTVAGDGVTGFAGTCALGAADSDTTCDFRYTKIN